MSDLKGKRIGWVVAAPTVNVKTTAFPKSAIY